jgi:hypothetical protein
MTANQRASTTMIWLKQFTTSTFSSLNSKIDRIDFLRRNKKGIAVVSFLWVAFLIGGHFVFSAMATSRLEGFFAAGAAAVERLAEESGPALLDDEVLGLSRKVAEFTLEQEAVFTVILNHESRIMAHSNPDLLNRPYTPLDGIANLRNVGEVSIDGGRMADGLAVATFTREVTFSGVKIGTVIFGIPQAKLQALRNGLTIYRVMTILLATLGAVGGVFLLDRRGAVKPPVASAPSDLDRMDGSKIGPYRLRERIAQGGMAELYMADYVRRDGFKRAMAVKRVLPHLAENQDFINMFIREARLAALLQHPNIVQIFDFGKLQNAYFIAMEYIDGMNLGQIMASLRSGLPVNMAMFIAIKISLGLDYSHKRRDDESGKPLGIVHRDISPQNILVSYQGEVKISDFGISKANTEPSLTQAGVIKGKLSYLSPEQAMGQPVDHQSDVYAMGLVLYEILTARRVYQFDTDIEAIRTIPEMVIDPINQVRSDIPEGLNRIIMKCLEKDKQSRYGDARELHDDLIRLKAELQIPYDASDLSTFMRKTFEHA